MLARSARIAVGTVVYTITRSQYRALSAAAYGATAPRLSAARVASLRSLIAELNEGYPTVLLGNTEVTGFVVNMLDRVLARSARIAA